MYIAIWDYQVRKGKQAEFETFHVPNGAWVELFKQGSECLGTELIQSDQTLGIYLTIDRWDSKEAYNFFLQHWKAEFGQLDRCRERLTGREKYIGCFSHVPA